MATLTPKSPLTAMLGGMMWLGSAQVLGRCVRLIGSILLARMLTPEVFGQAAIILTAFELIATLIRRISSARMIAMDEPELVCHLDAARKLNLLACIAAFVAMSLLSVPLSFHFSDPSLPGPMILMATSYLLMPLGMLESALNQRDNRMRVLGSALLWQTIADGLMTIALALMGLGLWAIIIPKVLSTLVWAAIHRRHVRCANEERLIQEHGDTDNLPGTEGKLSTSNGKRAIEAGRHAAPAKSKKALVKKPGNIGNLWESGIQTGLADFVSALRLSLDTLLVGAFLGLPALGVYFFASNAALGITLGIVQSFGTAFYSRLCSKTAAERVSFLGGLVTVSLLTSPLIALQCLLAPWYVPMLYGGHWVDAGAIPVFILLCLSGLCRPLGEAAGQLLLSRGLAGTNLLLNLVFSLVLLAALAIAVQFSLTAVAATVLGVYGVGMPLMALVAARAVKRAELQAASQTASQTTPHNQAFAANTQLTPSPAPFEGGAS
ncbi:oligosaccharide flippase family protein [Shewanella sp. JM162201]|uniref:Oligosaccharide flippase family protein n=1 Tax=Shewanella jiangmenensis TaxID=2837387 RepID=A0ABS5UY27_9GAMM|nr:oligosaccharide flippase family protein [Shewanella jiangmenensis]MBT1442986.1 oligosaccharide flippase family protein [Shewanella jiangmenensis]